MQQKITVMYSFAKVYREAPSTHIQTCTPALNLVPHNDFEKVCDTPILQP